MRISGLGLRSYVRISGLGFCWVWEALWFAGLHANCREFSIFRFCSELSFVQIHLCSLFSHSSAMLFGFFRVYLATCRVAIGYFRGSWDAHAQAARNPFTRICYPYSKYILLRAADIYICVHIHIAPIYYVCRYMQT